MSQKHSWFDWLGVSASLACAVHCAAMPFVVAALPLLGLSFLADEGFHQLMVIVCLGLAAGAFLPGWRRHGRWLPAGIAAVGLGLISTAAFSLEGQCCSACHSAPIEVASAEQSGQCGEACCELCLAASESARRADGLNEKAVVGESFEPVTAGLGLTLIPWITPLGGLLLVIAHLTNHQFVCRCSRCD